jgi:hypothetical protein
MRLIAFIPKIRSWFPAFRKWEEKQPDEGQEMKLVYE